MSVGASSGSDSGADERFALGPGLYYVGDLCHVLSDSDWAEVCRLRFSSPDESSSVDGEFVLSGGRKICVFSTAFGDGVYDVFGDGVYGQCYVASGSVGCILVDDIRGVDDFEGYGVVHEFSGPFDVSEANGLIRFGGVTVDTQMDEDEEE